MNEERKARRKRICAKYYLAHKETVLAATKRWADKNMERRAQFQREWRKNNPGMVAAQRKRDYAKRGPETMQRWRAANPEKIKCYEKRSYQSRKEYYLAKGARWRAQNPERQKALNKRWVLANPGRCREYANLRRALKLAASVGPVSYDAILKRDGRRCHICNKDILLFDVLHFDHVIPLSKGGAHTEENIRPSHSTCNLRKGAKLPKEK